MIGKKKKVLNFIFVLFCFILTIRYVLHGEDLASIALYMKNANSWYWVAGVLFVLIFILSESAILFYLLSTLRSKTKFSHCCLYSFVGFFFSCITPSASGGQPVQAVFMRKDDIAIHVSTVVLLIVTISYKTVLILYGLLILIFQPATVMYYLDGVMHWFYLGLGLNIAVVGFMILLAVKPKIVEAIVMALFCLMVRISGSKKLEHYRRRIAGAMENYVEKSEFLTTHKLLMFKIFVITFFQRTLLFAITYMVCISFGKNNLNFLNVTFLQGAISVAVDMLPLPGGMGISEYLFLLVFQPAYGKNFAVPIMIVSRGISYYTQLIISAIMSFVAYSKFYGLHFWRKDES
ncbi:MAG: lysylphosphatidylglycerol synthase transmembrane domain-containing protein [Bacillota bacterium]|nr:lysylphosphatidylglycerol synthase transmembrane domain-containing protein [Bacillota bacterium]